MLSVIVLSAVKLNVVMLSVVAPYIVIGGQFAIFKKNYFFKNFQVFDYSFLFDSFG